MSLILQVCKALIRRGIIHDWSKFGRTETNHYAPNVPRFAQVKYGTPEYFQVLEDMKPGVEHHYQNNDHHPEYWTGGVYEMSPIAFVEMLCDWKAACMRRGGDFQDSLEINQKRFKFSPTTTRAIQAAVKELGW
jgi:hypothetical protein